MLAGEAGLRLCLAGAQAKLPVVVDKDTSHCRRRGKPAHTF